jgi:hypothetical protein
MIDSCRTSTSATGLTGATRRYSSMVIPAEVLIEKAFHVFAKCVRQLRTLSSFSEKISLAFFDYVACYFAK